MNDIIVIIVFLALCWRGADAVRALLYTLQEAKITDGIRGYLEARFAATWVEYLINCRYCLSFWASLALSSGFFLAMCQIESRGISLLMKLFLFITTQLVIYGRSIKEIKEEN